MGLGMFKPETADWLRQELQRGVLCRAALARGLCERDGWHNPRGQSCAGSARKALPQLAGQLQLLLPPPRVVRKRWVKVPRHLFPWRP